MTRDDLFSYYHRYYIPNNATLVIVGDVDTDSALKRVDHHFGPIAAGPNPERLRTIEPRQAGERRLTIRKEGTAAYLKVGYHAPAVAEAGFVPALLLDAILTGAKGVNLWSSFRSQPPQRQSRLYRALVERGLASAVSGAMLPTEQPFLYTVSLTATEGTSHESVEAILLEELARVAQQGVTDAELSRAKTQLQAQLVFDQDSVTNVAHQLGYFETIGGSAVFEALPARIAATTIEEVGALAKDMFRVSNRTLGWFVPEPAGDSG
jgi:zinc protease